MTQAFEIEWKNEVVKYKNYKGEDCSYTQTVLFLDGKSVNEYANDLPFMARLVATLEQSELDEGDRESLEELATELAEELEIYFVYQYEGKERKYSPQAFWEPSNCEWAQSAQEGYDYGWDIY